MIHKKAEAMTDKVIVINRVFSVLQIKTSIGDKLYNIKYKKLYKNNCKTLFFWVSKICIYW